MVEEPHIIKQLREAEKKGKFKSNTYQLQQPTIEKQQEYEESTDDFFMDTRLIENNQIKISELYGEEILYQSVIELSSDGVFIFDLKGIVQSCNDSAVTLLGYSKEEIIGKRFSDIVDTIDKTKMKIYLEMFQLVLSGKLVDPLEIKLSKKDGKEFKAEIKVGLLTNNGKKIGMQAIVRDISSKKIRDDEIRKSEKELRDFFDNANDLIQSVDSNGFFKFVNKKWKEVMGYSDDEIKKLHFTDILREDYVSHCETIFKKLSKGVSFTNIDVVFKTKSGKDVFVNGNINGYIVDGELFSTRGIFRDMTKQRYAFEELEKSQRKLRESEQMLKEALKMAKMGRWDFYHADNRLKWSDTIFEIFEMEPANFKQSYEAFLELVHPDDTELVNNAWVTSLSDKKPYEIEHRLLLKDGQVKWVSEQCQTEFDEKGKPVHSVGIVKDITEHKRVEELGRQNHDEFLAILNGMDEPIYVSDPETYELIYANRVLKDLFGPIAGRKCYEYLQQRDKPCTFCTNEKIFNEQSDQSFVWEFQNTVNKRWYRCIDRAIPWPDGRTLRLEMAVDITKRKQIEDSVHFDNSFRSLIAEASARFVQVKDNKDFDNAVDQVLASLGNLFKVDRSYLFRFSKNLSTMDNTHEWCAPGITSQKNRLQLLSLDCYNWWKTQIFKLHPVQISDVEMLPAEAGVEKEEFQYQSIQSLINLPICNDRKKLIGFLGFDAISSPHIWPDEQLSMLQMLAEIIGNTIVRLEISNALSESEERLDRAMAVKNEGIWDWNLVTNETVFDDRYYTMAGYKPNEFPQNFSSWEKRVHPNDLAKSKTAIEAYLSGRTKRYDVEFRFKHKDGSWIWIRGRGKIVERDVNGSPLRMIGTHSNITEQKQIEGKLQAHYSMLKRTEAIANIGSWEWDIKKDEVRWSEEFFRIAKIPAENGAPSFAEQANLYVKEDYDKIRVLVEKCISNGTPYKTELRLIRKDGEIRHIIAQGQAKTDEKGEVCQLVGFVQDITERKQTEKKLEEERKRLEYILSITRTGINITDAEYNLQYVDDGWQKIYGDPSGRKCYEYFMGFSEPCQECGIPIALETKEVIVTEEKLPRENNRIVEVHTIPFKNSDEQWLVAEFNIDITERKKIEKEMERQVNTIQLLNQIISKGYSAKNTINYFQETLTVILCTLEYDGGSVILVDPDGETASVICSKNIPDPFLDRMKKVSIDDNSMFTKLFRENEMIVVENFANNNPELARILGFNSFIISPIVTDEMIVGALHLASFDVHVFTESETILLKSITSQMGTIIKNVRAEEKLIEKLNELENWKKVTVGRELRMKELKKKIKGLDERC